MSKHQRQATDGKWRERILFIDILNQQMLDLKALRIAVAKAEQRLMPPRRRASRPAARRSCAAPEVRK